MKNLAISNGIAFFVQKGHSLGVLIVFVVLKFVEKSMMRPNFKE
jgi:hypothetical protein